MKMQEDIVAKLIEFLLAPHATSDILLTEKETVCLLANFSPLEKFVFLHSMLTTFHFLFEYQPTKGKKRKRATKGSPSTSVGTSSKRSAKVLFSHPLIS